MKNIYCDYIALIVQSNLKANDSEKRLASVSDVGGEVVKVVSVEDRYGRQYKITVEEV